MSIHDPKTVVNPPGATAGKGVAAHTNSLMQVKPASARSEFDPFKQKGLHPAIALQFGPDKITICPHRPRRDFAILTTFAIGCMAIPFALILTFEGVGWLPMLLLSTSAVLALILGAFYAEAFGGPYVVIDPVARTCTFPRLKRELPYLEIRSLISGTDEESGSDDGRAYWFLDAEILDSNRALRRVTLIATNDRRQFQRLEDDIRAALGFQATE
jgi:hypothetical protein